VLSPGPSLYTDASAVMVGCQLAQCDDSGVEHPVAFASQKLTATQCAWSVNEREAYAIVWALNRFRNIIFGAQISKLTLYKRRPWRQNPWAGLDQTNARLHSESMCTYELEDQ